MNYKDFQHLARLFVVGALDEDEMEEFRTGRRLFGTRAEDYITECRDLNAIFALSLRPRAPRPETKAKLLAQIRATPQYMKKRSVDDLSHGEAFIAQELAFGTRAHRLN